MNDVYDIKTGKKLETISYGNNRQKKYHHAQAHNKYMTASQDKQAQREYNLLMKSICDSMLLRGGK